MDYRLVEFKRYLTVRRKIDERVGEIRGVRKKKNVINTEGMFGNPFVPSFTSCSVLAPIRTCCFGVSYSRYRDVLGPQKGFDLHCIVPICS